MTTVAAEYDHIDIQQQYQDTVNNRWDEEWDNENSSARLFERSRIKALAGEEASLTPWPWAIPWQFIYFVWNKGASHLAFLGFLFFTVALKVMKIPLWLDRMQLKLKTDITLHILNATINRQVVISC